MAGCFCLLYLAGRTVRQAAEPANERLDTYIPLQEAGNLAWLLADAAGTLDADALLEELSGMDGSEGKGYLTLGEAERMFRHLPGSRELFAGGAYHQKERILAADWYGWFDRARKRYDPEGTIQDVDICIFAAGERDPAEMVTFVENKPVTNNMESKIRTSNPSANIAGRWVSRPSIPWWRLSISQRPGLSTICARRSAFMRFSSRRSVAAT